MEFGLFYEIPVPRPRDEQAEWRAYQECIEGAVLADRLGYHSFWTVEHHFLDEFSHCSAPGVLYGHLAARTENLRIGHGVRLLPFPYNHPVRAAEAAAVVDLLSNGRLEFGTGRSATRPEMEGFGIRPEDTRPMWREALDVVVAAWTQEEMSHRGDHFDIPPRQVIPKPLQKPHPPLWAATSNPQSHYDVGKLGIGLLSFTIGVPPEDLGRRIDSYREGLADCTEPVGHFVNDTAGTFTMVHVAETDDEAIANARASFEWYAQTGVRQIATLPAWIAGKDMGTYSYLEMLDGLDVTDLTFDYLMSVGAVICGSPATCIDQLARYEAAGCQLLLCLVQPYGIAHPAVMRSIELLGTEVMPAFTGARAQA